MLYARQMLSRSVSCEICLYSCTAVSLLSTQLRDAVVNIIFSLLYKGTLRFAILGFILFSILLPSLFSISICRFSFSVLFLSLYFCFLSVSVSTPYMTRSRIARRDRQDDPPFSMLQDVNYSPDHFDAWWFPATRLSSDAQTVGNVHHGCEFNTAVDDCNECWWHWDGRHVSELDWYLRNTDALFLLFYEESGYEWRLDYIVSNIRNLQDTLSFFIVDDSVATSRPYDWFYAIANWDYWEHNLDFKMHMHTGSRFVSLGGHNV